MLLVEHRDVIFARLQRDLSRLGIGVYRATYPEDVFRVHSRIPIELTISNSGLPQASLWLTTAKLRIQSPSARVWSYTTNPDRQEREWARLVGIEKMFVYGGDLFELAESLQRAVRECWSMTKTAGDMLSEAS
uniref:Uncharacterized protein n=1 Tax=Schlesneria paludicola TaxID=360056 RepID=A0A7C2P1A5_9PLAN